MDELQICLQKIYNSTLLRLVYNIKICLNNSANILGKLGNKLKNNNNNFMHNLLEMQKRKRKKLVTTAQQ